MNLSKLFGILVILIMVITSCAPQKEVQLPTKVEPPSPQPAKVAVVLGAGSSKGFAHIGVLKILESNKIPIHMIVGTSV